MAGPSHDVQDAPPGISPCPHCRRLDQVMRVSAAQFHVRVPAPLAPAVPGLAGVFLGAVGGGVVSGLFLSRPDNTLTSMAIEMLIAASLVFAGGAGAAGIRRRRKRLAAGAPAARQVWDNGWYCRRCDRLYIQPGYEPPGVAVGQVFTAEEFTRVVFSAGGYGDLVDEYYKQLSGRQRRAELRRSRSRG